MAAEDVPELGDGAVGDRPRDPVAGNSKWAIDRGRAAAAGTSEPSGATASGAAGSCMVPKSSSTGPSAANLSVSPTLAD